MRLCGIGHDSARFNDVTLDFVDRHGRPTNSVLWLRNGGGKTSLLSLFFAGVRPNKKEFLGQRAEEKIRRLEDYVGPHDHGVVVCEWELDSQRGLFDDAAPLYLSGVFYQRRESDGNNGENDIDRLFFAALVSGTEAQLTLEGLPLITDQGSGPKRTTLAGFRRRLRQLDQAQPNHGIFVEDKNQYKFEEELISRGIDPLVFAYQIEMNEREGGVTQLFSFASDEDFADFLLKMTFDPQHARQVREQLSTFRQEIVERNEQLKPEMEYCQGLIVRLHKFVGITQERGEIFRQTGLAHHLLQSLGAELTARISGLHAEQDRNQTQLASSEQSAEQEREAADAAERLGAVQQRLAYAQRLQDVQTEYEVSEQARVKAKRQKEIGQAAVPLARVQDARREAQRHRDLLQQKLSDYAPELAQLVVAATQFANALAFDAGELRHTEQMQRQEAQENRRAADQAKSEASEAGERAAQDENQLQHLKRQVERAEQELQLLRTQGILLADETSPAAGMQRVKTALEEVAQQVPQWTATAEDVERQLSQLAIDREAALREKGEVEAEQKRAQDTWNRAQNERQSLEVDVTLLRLLQCERVDVEAAATSAASQASDELRRVADAILRIGVEAAEDERAIHGLQETELLPPTQDVQSLLELLRAQNIACWSGWEYLQKNVTVKERRKVVERVPQIVAGIIVASAEYDRVVELFQGSPTLAHRARTPVVVAPADALGDAAGALWIVVGPTSDAHFDPTAGAVELDRLQSEKVQRQQEITRYQEWREALGAMRHRLQQFQQEYPRGWFHEQRLNLDILAAKLEESEQALVRLASRQQNLSGELTQARQELKQVSQREHALIRQRDRLEQFERSFGSHQESWRKDLTACRERAEKARQLQTELKEKAAAFGAREQQLQRQANTTFVQAAQLEGELAKIKHVEAAERHLQAGATEELRQRYGLLLADYEGKVDVDALSRLADAKDQDAEREEREFRRVLAGLPQLTAEVVETELLQLPAGMTPLQMQLQADEALYAATGKLGPLSRHLETVRADYTDAERVCSELSQTGTLPSVMERLGWEAHQERALAARRERDEHSQLATELENEVQEIAARLTATSHELEKLGKDEQRLSSLAQNYEPLLARWRAAVTEAARPSAGPAATVTDSAGVVRQLESLEAKFHGIRQQQESLDGRRDLAGREVNQFSRYERYSKLKSSSSHRFQDREPAALETNADADIKQLDDRVFQIQEKLKEADQQREIVVHVLATAVDEALGLLSRVSRMSKLPESLPQAGKQFLKIETKASDNPTERRTYIGELIDEVLERGDVGDGLQLVQKAVRRVARRISVRVLHPDLHQQKDRVTIAQLRALSGGERLTSAILLYCALVRLRQGESQRRGGSSVLILDNPIGTASRLTFLEMQREVARALNVQLIYATAVNDLNAVGALENVIRLHNTRADRRTGRRFIELDAKDSVQPGEIETARIVFDRPASSLLAHGAGGNGDASDNDASEEGLAKNKVLNDGRRT
jgi:chromosome segregation ATPase